MGSSLGTISGPIWDPLTQNLYFNRPHRWFLQMTQRLGDHKTQGLLCLWLKFVGLDIWGWKCGKHLFYSISDALVFPVFWREPGAGAIGCSSCSEEWELLYVGDTACVEQEGGARDVVLATLLAPVPPAASPLSLQPWSVRTLDFDLKCGCLRCNCVLPCLCRTSLSLWRSRTLKLNWNTWKWHQASEVDTVDWGPL